LLTGHRVWEQFIYGSSEKELSVTSNSQTEVKKEGRMKGGNEEQNWKK
jgi:hypothetical protein